MRRIELLLLALAIAWPTGCAGKRLQIAWPPRVEVSTGNKCEVAYTAQATGNCETAKTIESGKAYWWRACGIIEWSGRGWDPYRIDIWSGDSRDKAIDKCKAYMRAFEKVRKTK